MKKMSNTDLDKAPESFLAFLWFLKNWRKYWRALIGFAVFMVLLATLGQLGMYVVKTIRARFSSVTMKVINFNYSTGEVILEFNNETQRSVPVNSIYITIAPTNSIPMKPLPPEFQRLVSVFDKSVMRIPHGAGLEYGPISGKDEMKRRLLRMAVFLIRCTQSVVLPPGVTSTNIVPSGAAFKEICNQFTEGAELEVILHTSLVDSKGCIRDQEFALGNYFIGNHQTGLKRIPNPKELDILLAAKAGSSRREEITYNISGKMAIPTPGDEDQVAVFENSGPVEILVMVGKEIKGLIPVILVKKSISYRCLFSVELQANERLPPDFAAWVLTRDEGKTVMNVPMAFSNNWSIVQPIPTPGKEYSISLPSTNWHLLIGGQRWARIEEGKIIYTVKEQSWLKVLPSDDATSSLLLSNYNRIALQEVKDDPSWVAITNSPICLTNSETFLIVQNEVVPSLSLFSDLRLSESPSNNAHMKNLPDGKPVQQ